MSPEAIRHALLDFADHPLYCREALTFRDKTGTDVPLVLSPGGIRLVEAVRRQEAARKPVRIVVLKPRQAYVSTTVASLLYKRAAYLPGQQCMVFGDLHKSAKNLWGYYHQFATKAREFRGIRRPNIVRSISDKRIEWDTKSWVEVASADTVTSGRSYSLRHLHLSEYAFYRDAGTLMTGLLQSVPDDPDTTVIIESTANGMGGPFYELCQRAQDPSQAGDWVFVFFGWWEHPEYTRPLDVPVAEFQRTLTPDEVSLVQRFALKPDQINWRRWAIRNKCEGNEDRFHQEYPATAEEAFLTSGRPRFDQKALSRMPVVAEWTSGGLQRVRFGTSERIQFQAREDGLGELQILRRPVAGEAYVIGADTAQGIDAGAEAGRSDPDYSVGCVVNRATGEQVAVLRARLTPATFGQYLVDLAWFYNGAFIVPESTGLGIGTIEEILRQAYPLDRVYWRRRNADDRRPQRLEELGYQTTEVSKPQLISTLERALLDGSVIVRHPLTLHELRTYVVDARGRTNAAAGGHDDCTIALALAMVGMSAAPVQMPPKRAGEDAAALAAVRYRQL